MAARKILPYICVALLMGASVPFIYVCRKFARLQSEKPAIEAPAPERREPTSFASVPIYLGGRVSMVPGDFNKDGNLDVIVATPQPYGHEARLYFFKGDGRGNFSQ